MERYCIVFNDFLLFKYNYEVIINKFLQFNVNNLAFNTLPMGQEFYLLNLLIFFRNSSLRIMNCQ